MRRKARFSTILVSALVTTAALADEFPPRKPGLWEVKVEGEKRPTVTLKMCIDKDTDELFHKMGVDLSVQLCEHRDVKVVDNVATVDTQCKIGSSNVTSTSITKFDGDTAFHVDTKSHFDPAFMGRSDLVSVQNGKWVGPCPADMEPGDMLMGSGIKVNIKMLNALKKILPKK